MWVWFAIAAAGPARTFVGLISPNTDGGIGLGAVVGGVALLVFADLPMVGWSVFE